MLSAAEIARGMQGALGFLRRDPSSPGYFENTPEACLRSFRVMLLVAPLYVVIVMIRYADVAAAAADDLEIALVEALRYVVDWLLFPVVFYEIARRRGWLQRYPRYISALNWVNLPVMIIAVVAIVLVTIVPPAVGRLIEFALQAMLFYWFLVITRMTLGVGWPQSVLLLVVNWVPSILLSALVARFAGAG